MATAHSFCDIACDNITHKLEKKCIVEKRFLVRKVRQMVQPTYRFIM